MRRIAILGSTGSIGTQALDVVRNHRDHYEVVALAAARNGELLRDQAEEFGVPLDRARLCAETPQVLTELASLSEVDVVLNAVVGFAGLPATLAALEHGKRLALANKESLIAGGPVVAAVRERGAGEIVPVDSEHSALYQCLRAGFLPEGFGICLKLCDTNVTMGNQCEAKTTMTADMTEQDIDKGQVCEDLGLEVCTWPDGFEPAQ